VKRHSKLLIGVNHTIDEKIASAHSMYEEAGRILLTNPIIATYLQEYQNTITTSWLVMEKTGVVAICTDCAVNTGGSCCAQGIENRFDATLLLINLLLGRSLPASPLDPTCCRFLGEKGCLLIARQTICVNYLCKRLQDELSRDQLLAVMETNERECDLNFRLEEALKACLFHI